MKSASINDAELLKLCDRIRQLTQLPLKERRAILEVILKEIDLVRREHHEQLVCIAHAKELRGYKNHSTIYRTTSRGNLHVYRCCCRDFFDRAELMALPVKGTTHKKAKIKVGMLGVGSG